MRWDVASLIPIFAAVLYGVILTVVVLTKPHTRLRRIFSIYLFTMVIWSISAFMTLSGLVEVLPWFRIMAASPIAMMLAIFYFVQTLFGLRRKWAPYALVYGILTIILSLFSDYVVQFAYLDQAGELQYQLSPFVWILAGPGYALIIISIAELVRGFNHTRDANQRNRLRYLIMGLSIIFLASLINFTELGKYPIDVAANGITAILIAYAILRHQLLEIHIVIRLGLLYSITTAIFGALYYLIIYLALNLFQRVSGGGIFILSVIVATLTAFILSPLWSRAQTWIDQLFYRERYNAGLMLQRLSQTTASLLDLNKITNMILSEVIDTLHIKHGAIFVRQIPDGHFHVMARHGENHNSTLSFRADHPIVIWLSRNNRVLSSNELNITPIFKSLWGKEREELENFQAELFIPLNAKGELVGFLVVGPKLSAQPYTRDDQLTLSTLANQTAVAIENARLYEDLEDTFVQTVVTLANAIDIRDTYTSGHSQRIALWASETAQRLGCTPEEVKAVYWGGLLHDIGKIGIPDAILRKPSSLDDSELEIIQKHSKLGAQLISPIKKLANVAPIIEYSHERFDGSGYPYGLKGEEIPIGARIVGVVDSFSAMRDERPYKKPFSYDEAIDELKQNAGVQFDPKVVDAFLHVLETLET